MPSLKGYCERCGNYDSYLRGIEGLWLCRHCREAQRKFVKPKIPFWIIIDPIKNRMASWKREIMERR